MTSFPLPPANNIAVLRAAHVNAAEAAAFKRAALTGARTVRQSSHGGRERLSPTPIYTQIGT